MTYARGSSGPDNLPKLSVRSKQLCFGNILVYSVISLFPTGLFQSFDWHFGHTVGECVVAHVYLHCRQVTTLTDMISYPWIDYYRFQDRHPKINTSCSVIFSDAFQIGEKKSVVLMGQNRIFQPKKNKES